MPDPFAIALAALHGSAGAVEAIYLPPGGGPKTIRVIRVQGTKEIDHILIDTNEVQIQRSDVAQPVESGMLTFITRNEAGQIVAEDRQVIQGGARLDVEGVTWNCYLEPA